MSTFLVSLLIFGLGIFITYRLFKKGSACEDCTCQCPLNQSKISSNNK